MMPPFCHRSPSQYILDPKSPWRMGSQAGRPHQIPSHIMNFDPPLRNFARTVDIDDFYGLADVFFHPNHLQIRTFVCIICKQMFFIQLENKSAGFHHFSFVIP